MKSKQEEKNSQILFSPLVPYVISERQRSTLTKVYLNLKFKNKESLETDIQILFVSGV